MLAKDLFNKLGYSWCYIFDDSVEYYNASGTHITVLRDGSIRINSDDKDVDISKEEFYAILVQLKEYGVTFI